MTTSHGNRMPWLYPWQGRWGKCGSVGLGTTSLHREDDDRLGVFVEFEQDAPVADATTKCRALSAEKLHVSRKGVRAHFGECLVEMFQIDTRHFAKAAF